MKSFDKIQAKIKEGVTLTIEEAQALADYADKSQKNPGHVNLVYVEPNKKWWYLGFIFGLVGGPAFELELWGAPSFEVGRAGILT